MKVSPQMHDALARMSEREAQSAGARIEPETFTTSLSRLDVEMLASAPYDSHRRIAGRRTAKLVGLGLLERNPTAPGEVRCTQQGTDVVLRFRQQGWIR